MESMERAIALGVLAPIAVGVLLFWLLWRRPGGETAARHVATSAVLPLLFVGACAFGIERPSFPPRSGADWILLITLAGGAISCCECAARGRIPAVLAWVFRGVLLAGGLTLVARNRLVGGWPVSEAAIWIVGGVIAGLAAWWGLARGGRERGPAAPLMMVLAISFSSVVTVLTGEISAALTPAALCAVLGPAFLVALRRGELSLGASVGFGAAFLAGNWFATSVLGETPWLCNVLAAASVALVGATSGRFRGWKGWLVRSAIVAAPGIAGVVWALMNQPGGEG